MHVVAFRRDFYADAFFSLTNSRACGVGIIFASSRFHQKAHCTFGANGRMLMLDMYVNGKRVRFVNSYAPVTRSDTNTFFKELHQLLLEPLAHVLLGDFNCVVNSHRDVRGPGQGKSTYHAKVLVKILVLPSDLAGKSDDVPLVTTLRGSPGPRSGNSGWRIDPNLPQDEDSVERVRDRLRESLENAPPVTPLAWDRLKEKWKSIIQEEGKAWKSRLTAQLNEILRRMKIIRGAELVQSTRDYLDTLEVSYTRLLRRKTRRPTSPNDQHDTPPYIDLRDVCGNGGVQITEAKRPDGSITVNPKEIAANFRIHFSTLFDDKDAREEDSATRQIKELCQNLRRPDEDETTALCREATLEELSGAIRCMPPTPPQDRMD
ncbi:hypothetical protein HPB52_022896 [Rhipicephalus sanguineus]|uniref:Uncharacterized protein n=1 Tax=Rhipicephalus sanguineus TaxID=34632 RepID=A0A9D4Q3P3_RHISA|nr:hypothetical protein HPB52_022896 [Rhipicephalus sanguineus]